MLKVKDEVDLKELEKFGFEENTHLASGFERYYMWRKSEEDMFINVYFVINIVTLSLRFDTRFDTRVYSMKNYDIKYLADVLFDLIQAGLVEKVVKE